MVHPRHVRRAFLPLAAVMFFAIGTPAFASEADGEKPRTVLETEDLDDVDTRRPDQPGWFSGGTFKTAKGHGFQYRRKFEAGKRKRSMIFSLHGPLVKKKTPGLGFEIKF